MDAVDGCAEPERAGGGPEGARHVRTMEDVLRLMDGLFAPAADRWTAGAGAW